MRLRAYLKGLGLGIFVTALILSLGSNNAKGGISDEEIRKRAAELGMVSENSLLLKEAQNMADNAQAKAMVSASSGNASKNAVPLSSDKAMQKKEVSDNSVSSGNVAANGEIIRPEKENEKEKLILPKEDKAATAGNAKDTEKTDTKKTDETPSAPTSQETASADPSEVVVITVNSGESSISVANKMVSAGLINDARQFDSYLVLNGYDRRLVPGSHSIPKSSSAQQMGEILTSH